MTFEYRVALWLDLLDAESDAIQYQRELNAQWILEHVTNQG